MRESVTEVIAGALVLIVAGFFLAYATQFAGGGGARDGDYTLSASFRSAEGVRVGTDVRMAGVRIGTVTGMELNPETFRAETQFAIEESIVLPEDTTAVVASEGLLGGTFIEMQPGGSPFDLEPGGEIGQTQSSVDLITLLLRYVTGSEDE